ncbi:MAG TPA: hypothetical protein VML54_13570 [Candidatus Limnocylindrales bacterium]|nr:hypothetical protein [Candidatus Limnocylindrales bacterium]
MNFARALSVAAVLTFTIVCASTAATRGPLLDEIKALTATDMDGRASGTPGGERAAHYIAGVLRDAGLQPAVGGDYLQLISARKAGDRAEIVYLRDGGERTVDATLGARQ